MIQEIITYAIIAGAAGVCIYNLLKFFGFAGRKSSSAVKCSGCSGGCDVKELSIHNKPKFKKQDHYKFEFKIN